MQIKKLIYVCLVLLISCKGKDDDVNVIEADIFINEISSAGDDWLEFYNSSEQTVDLSGFRVYDDPDNKYTLPSNTTIPGKGYLIVYCDETSTGLHTNFKLSSQGETVYLENRERQVINLVNFPALQEGQTFARFPDGSETFTITGVGTPGKTNGGSSAPAISSVIHTPLIPGDDDAVTISAEVKDDNSSLTVKLYYDLTGQGFTATDMKLTNNKYEGSIPKLGSAGNVKYYIEATDAEGNVTLNPSSAPTDAYSYLINTDPLPVLLINELLATNQDCCQDPDGVDENDDWIEIYNAGNSAVDIGGMYISDDKTNPFKYNIPDTDPVKTTIQPGGYLVLWADEQIGQGVLHLNFKLSIDGEDIGLYYIDGRTIDEHSFGAQTTDVSTGRSPDGSATWATFTKPTPGTSNTQ